MTIRKIIILSVTLVLAGCSPAANTREVPATPPIIATIAPGFTPTITETALSSQPAAYPEPPAPQPSANPYPLARTTPQPSPTPGKQLYVDPEGRYQVELPVDWRPGDQPGEYKGADGYFQAGDLPEMGFYSRAYQVCMRLVQTLEEPTAPLMSPIPVNIDSCQVVPIPYQNPAWVRTVIKAPGSPPEKRYFYFEADGGHTAEIAASLEMLVPTSLDDVIAFPSGPLRPADQAFWDTPRITAVDLPVTETRLEVPEGDSPTKNYQFASYVPRDLWLARWAPKPTPTPDPLVAANLVLTGFGYELRQSPTGERGPYDLYQDGKRIREQIEIRQNPILSASGHDFAFLFYSTGLEILRSRGIEQWQNGGLPEGNFRFLGENLLAPFWNPYFSSIDLLEEGQTLYRFSTLFGADFGLETFQVWQGHWQLEIRGFLIQDGEILNDRLGYEEIFNWQLVHGKPFFFFRKGPRVGISYDGQVQPVYYDDVAHYLCCGTAGNNPYYNGKFISFFAQRDGIWYFVQAGK